MTSFAVDAAESGCESLSSQYARLACYERSAILDKKNSCLALADDRARLACFDRAAPVRALSAASPRTQGGASPKPFGEAAAQPPPAPVPAGSAAKPRYRIEVGVGAGVGHYDGTIGKTSRRVEVDSFIAARGTEIRAAAWDDRLLGNHWGMGLEYNHFQVHARVHADLAHGMAPFVDPIAAELKANIHADMGFVNLAYHPRPDETIRPYVGGGIGAGRATLSTNYNLTGFVTDEAVNRQSSAVAGLQGFGGVEVDLFDGVYLAPGVRVLYFTGRPLGFPHQFIDANLEMNLGYRF